MAQRGNTYEIPRLDSIMNRQVKYMLWTYESFIIH